MWCMCYECWGFLCFRGGDFCKSLKPVVDTLIILMLSSSRRAKTRARGGGGLFSGMRVWVGGFIVPCFGIIAVRSREYDDLSFFVWFLCDNISWFVEKICTRKLNQTLIFENESFNIVWLKPGLIWLRLNMNWRFVAFYEESES